MFVQSHRKQQKLWLGLVFTFLSVLLVSPAPDQLVGFFVFLMSPFLAFMTESFTWQDVHPESGATI